MGKLTDKQIQSFSSEGKYADGDGLALVVKSSGAKLWWLRYRFGGKEKTLSIGEYPFISLAEAREAAYKARKQLSIGVDPTEDRKRLKTLLIKSEELKKETVQLIALEWLEEFGTRWSDKHKQKIRRWFEKDLFPVLGKSELKSVTPRDLLVVIKKIQAREALDTAHRLLQVCGQVWRFAVAQGRAERDITGDLRGAIPPAKSTNVGAITAPEDIAILLKNIDDYNGSEVVKFALKLAPFLFVRPGELRNAVWSEFDFKKGLWIIPAEKMKAGRPHVVPLSKQVLALLDDLRAVHQSDYLFPSPASASRPLSDMALLSAVRRMGYVKEEMSAHGFRAMASTNLEQLGFVSRLIELQLAHKDKDETRAAYKRNQHLLLLEERKKMMQVWADYLDQLKRGAEIIPLKAA